MSSVGCDHSHLKSGTMREQRLEPIDSRTCLLKVQEEWGQVFACRPSGPEMPAPVSCPRDTEEHVRHSNSAAVAQSAGTLSGIILGQ